MDSNTRTHDDEGSRTGVWLIGARGNVATTAVVGAAALARGETTTTGMVTAREPTASLDLPAVEGLVFGGHDVAAESLVDRAERLQERNGIPDRETLAAVREDLAAVDERIEMGTAVNAGDAVAAVADDAEESTSLRDAVADIRADLDAFRDENDLDRVVVINVASTEPPIDDPERFDDLAAFERGLDEDDDAIPASSLYAYAALADGHPYVNFTPSTGSSLGALRDLAERNDVPHTGRDAKTGETLMKSALGPMFAGRNLRVLSWEGHNVLGNKDGLVLEDAANKASKQQSKGDVLESILPEIGHNRVRIDYTPSLRDWKHAWDFVHFEGFLETEMKLQFTWEGADSALAAPLVLDLARLLAYADEHGEGGVQPHLASFFKDPMGVDEHGLTRQLDLLHEYAERHGATGTDSGTGSTDADD
ncbi:inositol-3-phosphate synthase [Halomicrobium salinisoli]|uniref:inositol-3-phosphate synthase n=1 Tax=Halomicrobium salinisoli TaxID=2878391 RepID=UPI001CF03B0E|nr:inositol-3-phosphate synthase [Halomicrobium salinisoli]